MRFGSVCSGIEAASVAFEPLGWSPAWFAEIEPFPCAVLAHRFPSVPNYGDMTALPERILSGEIEAPEMLCGGTPCQAFSVAGHRKSLDDDRGNLSLVFCEVANAIDSIRSVRGLQPAIVFWENVPGVLSTRDNAFGCFLAELVGADAPPEAECGAQGYREGSFAQYVNSNIAGTAKAVGGALGGGSETLVVGTLTASDLLKGQTNNQSIGNNLLIVDRA